ncbi:ATP-dependent protease ATP-binding subunit HslU [Loigolactobacillus backii]|uniref:ATP-dependent protease ATPase subunit HslU n=1 Tax=Loigolactobacillus backii TaxID=375175 RepID=UPI0007F05081|nr:ATP-dependent protease ATPase subunit HslU [Loigolactobacillus backii]ANK59485.1 ATP-dependent protease ATP-binding subunit HslU [Loigolactobacillus backii]ANK64478.1 ATP-dependent protease ATP-binding subunit HslU [Loigolactobacillus backii]ANK67126.1 HslU--HslV peptidase ATPase subunit [Loigolactobacillus backii]OLF70004.1 ATP-dependent protease [Loigolactobacillus backii]PIO87771.1 HslU--HslV peptidase ATPase subunit [Loigolactobacillus backii]
MQEIEKTPKQIVQALDEYVIGQNDAKKAIAVALRNRYRRMQLSKGMQEEITPKNMLMIGPTGVGKTEIARRLAKIVSAPFVKVEATKFTEVGYVGRDVESMVRDLLDVAIEMEKDEQYKTVRSEAAREADKHLVKLLVPGVKKEQNQTNQFQNLMSAFTAMQNGQNPTTTPENNEEVTDDVRDQRLSVKEQLDRGLLENREVTIEMDDPKQAVAMNNNMMGQMGIDLSETLGALTPKRKISRTVTVKEAREVFIREESEKLVNAADIYHAAIQRAENTGIIFIDEIDKIAATGQKNSGEVSREGVQRDILPIVEGSAITTKYGTINTDHVLFIASGAFSDSKPSDLIAELQGRFPIRVELDDLSTKDFVRILTEPNNALIKQYMALIGTDNIHTTFTKEAIERIAAIAYQVNHETENIGARRLHTILEKLLEDILYEGPDMEMGEITITEQYVNDKIGDIVADTDLSRYIL